MYYKHKTQRNDRIDILSYMYRPKTFILWKQCGILGISVKRGGGAATKVSTPYVLSHIEALLFSVFCMSTIVFEHSSYSTRYGVDQSSTCLCWDPVPLLCNDFSKLRDVGHLSSLNRTFQDAPQVFYWV